jgi:hypothetical protein
MTNKHSPAPRSAARIAAAARGLVAFAVTAATLSLTGCGDSGDESEDDASDSVATMKHAVGKTPLPRPNGSVVPDQLDRVH